MRDVDLRFTSSFIVRSDSPLNKIPKTAITPNYRLAPPINIRPLHAALLPVSKEASPRKPSSLKLSIQTTHDDTVRAVCDGKVDIGVANRYRSPDVRNRTQAYTTRSASCGKHPLTPTMCGPFRTKLTPALQAQLRDAFLTLTNKDPDQAAILHKLGAAYYLPASIEDFSALQRILADSSAFAGNRP